MLLVFSFLWALVFLSCFLCIIVLCFFFINLVSESEDLLLEKEFKEKLVLLDKKSKEFLDKLDSSKERFDLSSSTEA
jgi:hypothetical protein